MFGIGKCKPFSPSIGSSVSPESADAVNRTAPPPMIPRPLTAKKTGYKLISMNLTKNIFTSRAV